jgi:hypothetical protein
MVVATLGLLAASPLAAQEIVTLELRSPADGGNVFTGATVDWEIWTRITTPGNEGLALLNVDLAQESANPAKLDLPPADGVPSEMENFSRPAGISNPGEGGAETGYIGVQRGTPGEMNLVQIGGSQNTFGAAGDSMGTNPYVVAGVAKDTDVLLAAGSFAAPNTPGVYAFRIENGLANVLVEVNDPPAFSPVIGAAVTYVADTVSFTVLWTGDVDADGDVDLNDLAALLGAYNACTGDPAYDPAADFDSDGCVDLSDLAALIGNYGAGT